MNPRAGDWFLTHSGRQFWPLDPRPEDVDIFDIAHQLALTCRFNGACRCFYSVAQHSYEVMYNMPNGSSREARLRALLHDATEAYIGDMVRPLKLFMPEYRAVEFKINLAICAHFGLDPKLEPEIKVADNRMLMTERRDLLTPSDHAWSITPEEFPPYPDKIKPWNPRKAEMEFYLAFYELFE